MKDEKKKAKRPIPVVDDYIVPKEAVMPGILKGTRVKDGEEDDVIVAQHTGKPVLPGAEVVVGRFTDDPFPMIEITEGQKQEGAGDKQTSLGRPAQVATEQYRDGWEAAFGKKDETPLPN